MLDLDEIRARHEPYADTRVAQDIAALLSELDRLTSELAAKDAEIAALKAAPVVEWRRVNGIPGGPDMWFYDRPLFELWVVTEFPPSYPHNRSLGWWIKMNGRSSSDPESRLCGPETGDAGKAACEAAYRRACGLPAIPACAG